MNARRPLALWMALLAAFSLLMPGAALAEQADSIPAPLALFADDAGSVHLLAQDGLYVHTQEGAWQRMVSLPGVRTGDVSGDRLYVTTADNPGEVAVYSTQGELLARHPVVQDGFIWALAATDTGFALLYALDNQPHQNKLAVYDQTAGTTQEYPNIYNPVQIDADNGVLAVICDEIPRVQSVLALVDLRDGSITVGAESPPHGTMFLRADEQLCYVVTKDDVVRITWQQGVSKKENLPQTHGFPAAVAGDVLYAYQAANKLQQTELRKQAESAALVFATVGANEVAFMNWGFQLAVQQLWRDHQIKITVQNYETVEALILSLLAGIEPIDLLVLNNFHYAHFVKANVLLKLDDKPQIQSLRDSGRLADWYFTLSRTGDSLYVLPYIYADALVWQADRTLLEQSGLELPKTRWSWRDFAGFAHKLKQKDIPAVAYMSFRRLGLQNYLNQYVNPFDERSTLDAAALKEMLDTTKTLTDEGLLVDADSGRRALLRESSTRAMADGEPPLLVLPPSTGVAPVVDAEAGLIGINRNSKQQQAALQFIQAYLSPDPSLFPGSHIGDPQERMTLYPPFFSDAFWQQQDWLTPQQKEVLYERNRLLSMSSLVDKVIPIRRMMNEVLDRVDAGQITFEQAMAEMQSRADLMLNE